MKPQTVLLLIAAASISFCADSALADDHATIGQPSIFWHDGQWQTWKDGVWTPYGQNANKVAESTMAQPANESGDDPTGTRVMRPQVKPGSNHIVRRRPGFGSGASIGGQRSGTGQAAEPNGGIGQNPITIGPNNLGIGQANGIGQTTIGIGQPNMVIGQTTIGIGQPNLGLGQPSGMGQTTIGIGQPTTGLGQPNSVGQTTIGIGRQTESFKQPHASHRKMGD